MKPRQNSALSFPTRPSSWLGLCTLTITLVTAGQVIAQDTWDGGGGNGLWSFDTNWVDDVAPVPASAGVLTFAGGVQTTMSNDLTGVTVTSLSFTNNGVSHTAPFTLAGNVITLTTQTNAVVTTAIASGGSFIVDTISSELTATGIRQFNIGLGHNIILTGAFTGTGASLSKAGNGTLTVSNSSNTYTGITYVDAGTLKLGNNNVLSSNTLEIKRANQSTNLNSDPILDLNGFSDTIGGITLGNNDPTLTGSGANLGEQSSIIDTGITKGLLTLGGGISYRAGSGGAGNVNGQATISANLATGNTARTLFIGDGVAAEDLVISGAISGSGTLTKQGVGTLMLSGANTHTGSLNIETGTVKLGASGVLPDPNVLQLGVNNSVSSVIFDINGNSETIGALRLGGAGGTNNPAAAGLTHSIVNSGLATAILTLGNTFNYYAGVANQNGQATISAHIDTGNAARNLTVEDSTLAAVDLLISGNMVGVSSGFNKNGSGVLALSGVNTYGGATVVGSGVLLLNGPNALPGGIGGTGGTSALSLNGGILGLGDGDFNRTLGTGVSQVNLSANLSGFAAFGADRIVNLGGSSAAVTWGSGNFMTTGSNFALSHATATHTVDFQNSIVLNGTRIFVVNNGTATVDAKLSGDITGSTTFSKAGAGTLELTNTGNAWTGTTYIDSGTLRLGAADVLPSTTVEIKRAAGTDTNPILDLNGFSETIGGLTLGASSTSATNIGQTVSIVNSAGGSAALTLTGTFLYRAGSAGFENGQATISANIDTGNPIRNLTVEDSPSAAVDVLISGTVVGSNGFNKAGPGTLALSAANTYTGVTTPVAGTLALQNNLALQNSALITTGAGTITLGAGVNTPTIGGLSGATGNLATLISSGYGAVTSLTLNPNSGAVSYGGVIADGATGMTLSKTGSGTQTLSGANTYTGTTDITAGKLVVTNSIGSSAVTVSGSGAILASDTAATIGNTLTVNNGAILAVGDAANATTATATVIGASTFKNGSIFSWDINAAGTSYDKLITASVAGELAPGDAVFRIVAADSSFADSFWLSNQSWSTVITTNGTAALSNWATLFGSSVSVVDSSFATLDTSAKGTFTLSGSTVNWTAVPEPTSALAGLLITAGLLRRRRA